MTGDRTLHAAGPAERARLQRTLVASGAFADGDELERVCAREPWRIQVTDRGDAAVISRWREHVNVLAVEALWCRERDIVAAIEQLHALAGAHGYDDLLGPPVPLDQVAPYVAAGMRVFETVTTFRRQVTRPDLTPAPARLGVSVGLAEAADIDAVLEIDAACFDEFWRYDRAHLERFGATERFAVARGPAGPIGYTLSTVRRGEGLLGRIGVAPGHRARGVGRMLVADVIEGLRERGASEVALCTRQDNRAGRALYAACGFAEVGQPVAFVRFGG